MSARVVSVLPVKIELQSKIERFVVKRGLASGSPDETSRGLHIHFPITSETKTMKTITPATTPPIAASPNFPALPASITSGIDSVGDGEPEIDAVGDGD
jgi:hypothetical protein